MKLGIMQPYFFPYIGYFDLIFQTDRWIVFDNVQFIRHGWVNRNRILHPSQGWQYIILPTRKHNRQTDIKDICIADKSRARDRILGQLQHYRKTAPFYMRVREMIEECLSGSEDALSRINVRCLERACAYLGIPFQFSMFSEMELNPGPIDGPGDWALRISETLGASEYINPPGGVDLFDPHKFEAAGIKLTIQAPVDFQYQCNGYDFQPGLSIIDVMMWNSPDIIHDYLISRQQKEAS